MMNIKKRKLMNLNRFDAFISETIRWETGGDRNGGYTNNPKDAGKETKWGISKKAHPELNIKDLTYKQAIEIYKQEYYNPYYDLIMSDNISFKVFDMGVLTGPKTSIVRLQRTIRHKGEYLLRIDGKIGPMTLTALQMSIVRLGEENFYNAYIERYKGWFTRLVYAKPWNQTFYKGWINRVNFQFKDFNDSKSKK